MHRFSYRLGFTCLVICATFASTDAAEPVRNPALSAALRSLFAEAWDKSADGLARAESRHREARAAAPSDPRVDFSLALVQWRYLRYSDALKSLDGLVAAAPNHLPAAQARIYLLVLMKKHSQAVAELDTLAKVLATNYASDEHATARREAVEFLGRIFGYYEGPAGGAMPQATVADVRARILDGLGTADREAFSAAFGGVRDRFVQLDDEKRRTADDAKAAEERQKELDLQRLGAERAEIDADKKSLETQAAEAQKVAQEQVDRLDHQIVPLEAEYARINAQGAVLRTQIAQLDLAIADLLAQADATDDDNLRAILQARANGLAFQARRLEIDYQVLDGQAAQIVARRNALLHQRGQAVARYEAEARRLGVQAAKLGKNEKRIVVETKKTLKPATGLSPQVQGKAATTASITSYVEFPLERERLRILASLE